MRILVVEDNELTQEGVIEALNSAGYETDKAGSGLAALTRLEATGQFSTVVADHYLPAMDGLSLLRRMRQNPAYFKTPFILTTAAAQPDADSLSEELKRLAPARLLRKPFEASELISAIKEYTS